MKIAAKIKISTKEPETQPSNISFIDRPFLARLFKSNTNTNNKLVPVVAESQQITES